MNDLSRYDANTNPYEVLCHLQDKLLAGDFSTFAEMKAYCAPIPAGQRKGAILKRAFDLQRQLQWGFFRNVKPELYPKVWSQVVIVDKEYPFAGDLKRFNSITDLYMGMIDIHGYTKYCRENRNNISMLDVLDRMLQIDIPSVAAKAGVVSRRSRGDEILLLGASAEDVLASVLDIIDYLRKRQRLSDGKPGAPGSGSMLPAFQISAGIAGGQKYTPLIITLDGDLSGDIVNTAARLQARANKISPEKNKVLVTSHVYQRVKPPEGKQNQITARVDFLDTGTVEFKGTVLQLFDCVFLPADAHRLKYRDNLVALYDSIEKRLWKSKIFDDAMTLASRVATFLPDSAFATRPGGEPLGFNRQGLLELCKTASSAFAQDRYDTALRNMDAVIEGFRLLGDSIDSLVMEYLLAIQENYATIHEAFLKNLDRELEERLGAILTPSEKEKYVLLRKNSVLFEGARETARARVKNRRVIWFRVSDESSDALAVRIQTKK